jgi:hypothetical protein
MIGNSVVIEAAGEHGHRFIHQQLTRTPRQLLLLRELRHHPLCPELIMLDGLKT